MHSNKRPQALFFANYLVRDPETMPLDSGIYRITQQSRCALSSTDEELFVKRVQKIIDICPRDYTLVEQVVVHEAIERGYEINRNAPNKPETILGSIRYERRLANGNETAIAHLFIDIVIAAILRCPEVRND